ncbi:hypothetical protein Tco_0123546 [Tanacetum coccineum]
MQRKILYEKNARRVDHQNSQRLSHLHSKRNFVPRAVLMKSGLKTLNTARQNSSRAAVSVNTARPINTAYPSPTVNYARPTSNVFNRAHSPWNQSLVLTGNQKACENAVKLDRVENYLAKITTATFFDSKSTILSSLQRILPEAGIQTFRGGEKRIA